MLESIKKVDKKIIAMAGIMLAVVVVIIIAIIIVSLTSGRSLSYEKIEKKLVSAAENYGEDNNDKMPKKIGEQLEIDTATLVSGGYIKDLSEYTDEGVSCKGKVIVGKNETGLDFVASLDCGGKYKTPFLKDKLLENVVTSGNGLYKVDGPTENLGVDNDNYDLSSNELLSGYVFRGENIKNYIKIGKVLYRIVKIDANGDIMIVNTDTRSRGVYDDRYNNETGSNSGINNYSMSRALEGITKIYEELEPENLIKQKIVSKNVCVGARSEDDTTKDGSTECKAVMKDQLYSLLPAYDILYASLSSECVKTTDGACTNYNYLTVNSSVWTMTPNTLNTYTAYKISGGLASEKIERSGTYKYAFYLSNRLVYESGTGTESDPYIVK